MQVGGLTITPVEQVSIRLHRVGDAVAGFASKRPVAVVVRAPEREWRIELPAGPR